MVTTGTVRVMVLSHLRVSVVQPRTYAPATDLLGPARSAAIAGKRRATWSALPRHTDSDGDESDAGRKLPHSAVRSRLLTPGRGAKPRLTTGPPPRPASRSPSGPPRRASVSATARTRSLAAMLAHWVQDRSKARHARWPLSFASQGHLFQGDGVGVSTNQIAENPCVRVHRDLIHLDGEGSTQRRAVRTPILLFGPRRPGRRYGSS